MVLNLKFGVKGPDFNDLDRCISLVTGVSLVTGILSTESSILDWKIECEIEMLNWKIECQIEKLDWKILKKNQL